MTSPVNSAASTGAIQVGPAIAAATHRVLRPGGAFLVYQFTTKSRAFMAKHFSHIDAGFEPLNVLPCTLYWGWKD